MATKKNTQIGEYEYYRFTKTIGHKPDGKPIKKQFLGTSKRDAELKYEKWKEEQGELLKPKFDETKTFGEVADYYCDEILMINSKYALSTRELYSDAYKTHIQGSKLCSKPLYTVRGEDVQILYNQLAITKSALATTHKFMVGFFKWAANNKYCENIIESVIIPEKKIVKHQEGIVVWTDREIEKILADEDYLHHGLVLFAVYTGMRMGELLGLKWEDIYDDMIHITRQFQRGTWQEPKNRKKRTVPLHPKLKTYVKKNKKKKGLVFCTVLGTPLDHRNVSRSLSRYYKRIGIEHKKFHAYRATFCTNLCKKGVPLQTVAKLAGHESVAVTAKYYAFVDAKEMATAIDKL